MRKIHGSTDIILKTKYGRVERIHSENTFQGGILSEGLRDLGYSNASIYPNQSAEEKQRPAFSEIVGGIFLFENQVPNNSQFMNAGNRMIGNGAFGVTNSAEPNELGSYNDNESIVTPSKIIQVYDFTTSQALGEFRSVCLTSRTGGLIGYGNENMKQVASPWNIHRSAGLLNACPQASFSNDNTIICDGVLYNFTLDSVEKTLTVKKYKLPLKSATVFDGIPETLEPVSVSGLTYSAFSGAFAMSTSDGKIYLSPAGPGRMGTAYVWEYDPATGEVSEMSFTNTSGTNYDIMAPRVAKGKVFIARGSGLGGWSVYNLNGSEYDTIPKGYWGEIFTDSAAGGFGNHVLINWTRDEDGPRLFLYDIQSRTIRKINGQFNISWLAQFFNEDEDSRAISYLSGRTPAMPYAFCNPLYLATINNLPEPVEKTVAESMKILYTLEEV